MPSTISTPRRKALAPRRAGGRLRVAALMDAAAAVLEERGYEATTMAEIAARADARIGSLYRFFPSKEAIGDALADGYAAILAEAFATLAAEARHLAPEVLADRLIDMLVDLHPQIRAVRALLDSRTDWTDLRLRFRADALAGIAAVLQARVPGDAGCSNIGDMAIVVLATMRTMLGMVAGQEPSSPGALAELRAMNRLYLVARLTALADR